MFPYEIGIKRAQLVLALDKETIETIVEVFRGLLKEKEERWDEIRFEIFPKTDVAGQIKDYNIKQNQLTERAHELRYKYDFTMREHIVEVCGVDDEDAELIRQQIIYCYMKVG